MGLNVLLLGYPVRYQSLLNTVLQRCHPLPVVTKDLSISPRLSPYIFFIAMQVQHFYDNSSTNQWLNFTYSHSHDFRYGRKKEHN